MASPQPENGHTDICNDIVDRLCLYRLSGQEWQIIWVVLRKTWGWKMNPTDKNSPKKKLDRIALSQFAKLTGIDRRKCHAIIQRLLAKKVLKKVVTQLGDRISIKYGFQKDYDKWIVSPKKVTVTQKGAGVTPNWVSKVSPKKAHTKETSKETFTKDNIPIVPLPNFVDRELWDQFIVMRKKKKATPTEFAIKLLIKKLTGFHAAGFNVNKIIELSIENNWKGFFEPKNNKKGIDNDKYTNF